MHITITRTDVEEMTDLCPTDCELDEIARKLERDYRAQFYGGSLEVIAALVVNEGTSEVRKKLREVGVENFDEILFCASYEDIVTVIEDEVASIPEGAQDSINWKKLLQAAEDVVRDGNLYDQIAENVRNVLYPADN